MNCINFLNEIVFLFNFTYFLQFNYLPLYIFTSTSIFSCICLFYIYKVEELPFLLTRAGELERLKETVSKLDVFFRLAEDEDGVFELVKAWKTVSILFHFLIPSPSILLFVCRFVRSSISLLFYLY